MFLEACGQRPEVFEFVEESLDQVAVAVEERAEGGRVDAPLERLDVGPRAAVFDLLSDRVAIVGAVGDEDLAGLEPVDQGRRTAPVVRLARRQGDRHGQAVGVDQRMDLGGQSGL